MNHCDNKSVGVLITNQEGELLLLERARFPFGLAPPAGHIDDHGSPEQTAIDEVQEEVGLALTLEALTQVINGRRVYNKCRRPGGDHHDWTVFTASDYSGELLPDKEETRGARWYSKPELQNLADKPSNIGLEPVWKDFLLELGYISLKK